MARKPSVPGPFVNARRLAGTIALGVAFAGSLCSTSALAQVSEGTFVISGTTSTTRSGTFTTAQGDTGTFVLTQLAFNGYAGWSANTTTALEVMHDQAIAGGDRFSYQLVLTPTPPAGTHLAFTMIAGQRGARTAGNNEPVRVTYTFSGASAGSSVGVLTANPNVTMHATNGTAITGSIPQVRSYTANPDPLVQNTTPPANYPALAVGSTITSGSSVQLFGVLNSDSRYVMRFRNANTLIVAYVGNLLGVSSPIVGLTGETFNEWYAFGVSTALKAVDDSVTGVNGVSGQTNVLNVLTGDRIAGSTASTSNSVLSLASGSSVPSGFTFDTATGNISVAAGTASGTYSFNYQICDSANTTVCVVATASVTIAAAPSVDMQVVKSNGATQLFSGSTTTYSLVVTNNGPDAATGAIVRDTPVAGITCPGTNAVTITGSGVPAGSHTVADLTGSGIALGTLGSGASATLTFSCQVN